MGPKFMNFIRRLKRGIFFCARVSKNIDLSGVWTLATNAKFQHNISKTVPARQKNKHRAMGCEYQYSYNFLQASLKNYTKDQSWPKELKAGFPGTGDIFKVYLH